MSRARALVKLCLVLLIAQSVSCDWKPNNKEKETLCKEPECKARGEEYKKNLNAKIHPCQDFYTFTCGNWQKNHPGPKYTPEWSILDELNFDILNIIRKTLESYNFQQGDDTKFRQAKTVYEYCVKIPQYPVKEAKDIAREITNIGRVPKTPLWSIHSKYLQLSGESSFFRTQIMGNPASKDSLLLMFMEPHSAYGSIFHEEVWKPQEKQAYIDFLFLIMKSLKLKDPDAEIKERVGQVFQFREKFNRIIRENKKKKPDGFSLLTGQELDNWFSQALRQKTSTQDILWKDVIDSLLPHVPANTRRSHHIAAIRQKQYFLDLMNLLKDTSQEVIVSHMEIYFVESHLKFNEKMYKVLEGTAAEPHGLFYHIRDKYYPRWHTCIQELNMKKIIEKLLYQKWFPKDYTDTIRTMSSKIKSAIEDQLGKSYWLDTPTREETARRIKNVKEWVGFPPWIDGNGPPTARRNPDDVLTAQASLKRSSNVLNIQVPLLLPLMFSPTIPKVYNYAGIGSTLGHELYHVINDCGRFVTEESGEVVWWKLPMQNECIARKYSFIDVYNNITDREFKNRYDINVKSDTSASFLENYPDVMGLEAAYNAYKELAPKETSVCQTLPNFEKYSCDQMFYIGFANTYCGFYTKKSAKRRLFGKTTHSLDSIRVNGAVAQMKSFGTAFGCPVGSPMNPMEKLNLWK